MHPRIIRAIARKDALDLLLNKQTLFGLMVPILLAVLYLVISLVIGSSTTEILVYDPGYQPGKPAGIEQVLTGAFSNAHLTQAGSPQQVADAFGANGTHRKSPYAVGLVVPPDFEANLRAGKQPTLQLYINGDSINNQQSQLLQSAIANYSRAVVSPAPITLSTSTINPPARNSLFTTLVGIYALSALLASLLVGIAIAPGLLIEEKEKKTLRVLMVSPASWADVIAAKLLVAFVYQILVTTIALAIARGFTGQVPLVVLFVLLGSFFSVAVGALAGCIFKTQSAAGAFSGMAVFIFILPIFFLPSFGVASESVIGQMVKVLPPYWIADGVAKALQNQATLGNTLLDLIIVIGSALLFFLIAVWGLRRQASVVSTI